MKCHNSRTDPFTNYVLDNVRTGTGYAIWGADYTPEDSVISSITNGLIAEGVSQSSIIYNDGLDTITTGISNGVPYTNSYNAPPIRSATNLAGYVSWGEHDASLGDYWDTNGAVQWSGESGWCLIETIESFNGQKQQVSPMGSFVQWLSANAFGGTNYSDTPDWGCLQYGGTWSRM